MFCNKATWPGSLCACSSCDPGSGGASRARGILPLTNELPGQVAFFALALCRAKGDTTMVCASVPYLGYKPQLCLARPMLFGLMDREPFCPNDRQPIVTTWQAPQHDEDDEGGACCWKGGAV